MARDGRAPRDDEVVPKDTSYSPASERETRVKQDERPEESAASSDADVSEVRLLPGTGGPDDSGDTGGGGEAVP